MSAQTEALRIVREYQSLHQSRCAELCATPSPLDFARFVGRNRPFVVRGYASQARLPASHLWTPQYLVHKLGNARLPVALTPSGRADAIDDSGCYFVEPDEVAMTLPELLDRLDEQDGDVPYLQSQSSNLHTDELRCLLADVGSNVPLAQQVFGSEPDAVNLWIGNSRSTTSIHSDPYENLYVVIRGTKTFTLLPPTEHICLHYREYDHARYERTHDGWRVVPSDGNLKVPWASVDPVQPDRESCPRYVHARPMTVHVGEGDLLYLPALWFHHVSQSGPLVIAVNWWHDMDYESPAYALAQTARRLSLAADGHEIPLEAD